MVERTRDLAAVLAHLYSAEIRSVYVEAGPTLASALVAAGLVDEYLVFLAPALLGGPRLALGDLGVESIGGARRLPPLGRDPRRRPPRDRAPRRPPRGRCRHPGPPPHALQMETH